VNDTIREHALFARSDAQLSNEPEKIWKALDRADETDSRFTRNARRRLSTLKLIHQLYQSVLMVESPDHELLQVSEQPFMCFGI
jgi:hypothetical protein